MTNINEKTGIRYGTIYLHHLDPDTASWLWDDGEDTSYAAALEELEEEIRTAVLQEIEDGDLDIDATDVCDIEREVERRLERESDGIQIDEPTIEGTCEGVTYAISWLGGAPLLWVFHSPIIGKHGLCSPCVPNAGDLESEGEYECYDVPEEWKNETDH